MPNIPNTSAQAPKRQRGHLRVAAIMESGAEIFVEKGFDAATMTEIAARSGTAIGSLYRFFPSKESLADALLLQYTQHVMHSLAELEQQAQDMPLACVVDGFMECMLSLQSQRSVAIALVEERGGLDARRKQFREAMRGGIAKILRKALPGLDLARAKIAAIIVLHLLKAITSAMQEKPALRRTLMGEIRELLHAYLVSVQA